MDGITILGCRENNLKNIDLTIPYSKIVTFIGVSGSGKTTLVFDTLYAEGKRRYIESLGVNESYFLTKIKKPDADHFIGLPPAIALAQDRTIRNPRSTVGTISQAAYYFHLLFSSCGEINDINSNNKKEVQLSPSMFNLNSPNGMCLECNGEGELLEFDETLIWPNQELSIAEGGLKIGGAKKGTTKFNFLNSFLMQYGYDVYSPIKNFSNELKVALLFGQKKTKKFKLDYPGIIPDYEKIYKTTKSIDLHEELEQYMSRTVCQECYGTGYRQDCLKVTIAGKNIAEYMSLSIEQLKNLLEHYRFYDYRDEIYEQIKGKLLNVLNNCIDLGVGYLSLNRSAATLSGGEMQRLRLVSQISSQISGVVYVLDEPSSGMHPCDIERLLAAIKNLNSIGNKNTVVLVEHTPSLINASDYIFEIGPGAGELGGRIVAQGTPAIIRDDPHSISGKYLSYSCTAGTPNWSEHFNINHYVGIIGANAHNLRNVQVKIPLHSLVCITGVSGSGKTSLVFDSFYSSFQQKRNINLTKIEGLDLVERVVLCDQSSIGNSMRSCPATYSEAYALIRKLFAHTNAAKKLHFTEKHFSFNLPEGQCENCRGEGQIKINMGFLPQLTMTCEACDGKRFKKKVLEVKYKEKTVFDVLNMSIREAILFFQEEPSILTRLEPIDKVGLGYIKLGQPTTTLSGGESQRLKLAYEISKANAGHTLLIFDEPSRGLHFEDVKCLLSVIKKLIKAGHSIIIVEHNLDLIASCDYVIDLGPGAGVNGGAVVGEGTPVQISRLDTPTGNALKNYYKMCDKYTEC